MFWPVSSLLSRWADLSFLPLKMALSCCRRLETDEHQADSSDQFGSRNWWNSAPHVYSGKWKPVRNILRVLTQKTWKITDQFSSHRKHMENGEKRPNTIVQENYSSTTCLMSEWKQNLCSHFITLASSRPCLHNDSPKNTRNDSENLHLAAQLPNSNLPLLLLMFFSSLMDI